MREYKFRAWDTFNKCFLKRNGKIDEHVSPWMPNRSPQYKVTQYTGLKDKNGVEIYEGDILRIFDENYEVKVIETGSSTYIDYGYSGEHNGPCNYWSELIGNIYQNPKLMEAADR